MFVVPISRMVRPIYFRSTEYEKERVVLRDDARRHVSQFPSTYIRQLGVLDFEFMVHSEWFGVQGSGLNMAVRACAGQVADLKHKHIQFTTSLSYLMGR